MDHHLGWAPYPVELQPYAPDFQSGGATDLFSSGLVQIILKINPNSCKTNKKVCCVIFFLETMQNGVPQ
jgi:hypothetical protein